MRARVLPSAEPARPVQENMAQWKEMSGAANFGRSAAQRGYHRGKGCLCCSGVQQRSLDVVRWCPVTDGVLDFRDDFVSSTSARAMRSMPDDEIKSSKHVLDPIDRVSEVLFGLIMVLTFTGSLSVAEAGREDVHAMLIGALGCNLAWGIIDAVLYLMGNLAEKSSGILTLRAVRTTTDPQEAQRLIADSLPSAVASVLEPAELESLRLRLQQLPEPPERAHWRKEDWLGALSVFLLVFLATFPVVIPFMVMHQVHPAMRLSNAIAIGLLFLAGYTYGRITRRSPWAVGVCMVVLGCLLVGMTMALGG